MDSMAPPKDRVEQLLEQLAGQVGEMNEALLGSARPGSAPGLLTRMGRSEDDRSDLRRRLEDLAARVKTLEAEPGRVALSWLEKLALGFLSIVLAGLGAIVGRIAAGGTHP